MSDTSGHHGLMATPRSRGALTGFALMALGAWGALIPFIGTYFSYAYTPTSHWTMTLARFFLEVAPGIVTFVGGLLLLVSGNRFSASFGGYAAIAAGAWFVVGPLLAPLFRTDFLGTPTGGKTQVAVEQIGFFFGLGAAIVLFAALAVGRFSVVSVRDAAVGQKRADRKTLADQPAPEPTNTTVRTPETGPRQGAVRAED